MKILVNVRDTKAGKKMPAVINQRNEPKARRADWSVAIPAMRQRNVHG